RKLLLRRSRLTLEEHTMSTTTNTLKISAAVVIQGLIYRPGTIVQVPTALAHDLMRRGRAELAGDADGPVAVIIDPPNGGAPTPNTLPPTENNEKPAPRSGRR
ncbi:hypothetical protein LOD44_11455, partial [Xylella fastidiosa subsp. multiplex]